MTLPVLVTVGPRQWGHTQQAVDWVVEAPENRAIVVAYVGECQAVVERLMAEATRQQSDEATPKPLAWWSRRVIPADDLRRNPGMLTGWVPDLWLDDALEIARQFLRLGSTPVYGASIKAEGIVVRRATDAGTEPRNTPAD